MMRKFNSIKGFDDITISFVMLASNGNAYIVFSDGISQREEYIDLDFALEMVKLGFWREI